MLKCEQQLRLRTIKSQYEMLVMLCGLPLELCDSSCFLSGRDVNCVLLRWGLWSLCRAQRVQGKVFSQSSHGWVQHYSELVCCQAARPRHGCYWSRSGNLLSHTLQISILRRIRPDHGFEINDHKIRHKNTSSWKGNLKWIMYFISRCLLTIQWVYYSKKYLPQLWLRHFILKRC